MLVNLFRAIITPTREKATATPGGDGCLFPFCVLEQGLFYCYFCSAGGSRNDIHAGGKSY